MGCVGGCHFCEGTSKDSSADVSKQDGCQVSSVNYLGNKNWLMFMRHTPVPKTALCFFNTTGSCFFPWSVNFLCAFCLFFNQMDWIFVPFDHTECQRGIFLLWAAGKLMTTLCFLSSHRQMKEKIFSKKPLALFFLPLCQLSSSVSEEEAPGNNHLCLVCLEPEGLTGLMVHWWLNHVWLNEAIRFIFGILV